MASTTTLPENVRTRPGLAWTSIRTWIGVAETALGVALDYVAISVIDRSESAPLRVVFVLAGLVLARRGIGDLVCGLAKREVDVGLWLSVGWLVALVVAATLAGLLPFSDYIDPSKSLTVPQFMTPNLFSAHPLGTDGLSLDLLARCVYGARVSILTSALAVVLSVAVGVPIGALAALRGRAFDHVVNILTDSMLSVPALVLLIALATIAGRPKSVAAAVLEDGIGLAIVTLPTVLRLARSFTSKLISEEFVFVSRALGATNTRIVLHDLTPNVLLSVSSYALVLAAVLIVAEGSLSFLGLGLQPPQPTWGNMMAQAGISDLSLHPFAILVPGTFMFLTVFSLNRVGERARSAFAAGGSVVSVT
jgi:peptide/nickel transport system permease protein